MNKISRHALAFNSGWFEQHQRKLLWLVNHPLLSYWFRWILRIHGDRSSVGRQQIVQITPNAIFWLLPNGAKRAEIRTHAKFGKRLYHAFRPLWWAMHFFDWLLLDRWMPEWSFGFATLTAYPQAGSGGGNTTVDGTVYTFLQPNWDSARTATSGNAVDATGATGSVYVGSFSGSYGCTRYFATLDTSSLGSGATISAATFSLYITYYNSPAGAAAINLVASTQASNNSLSTADFDAYGSTTFAQRNYDATSTGQYRSWTLNSSGLAAISKTGVSKFALRDNDYDVGGTDPGANEYEINFYMADRTGTSEDPKLDVTYSTVTTLTPGAISAGTSIHSPSLAASNTLAPGAISAGTAIYTPSVNTGGATIAPGAIAATTSLFAATLLAGALTVAAPAIATGTSIPAPTLRQAVPAGTVNAATVVRTPTVLGTSYHTFTFAANAEGLVDNGFSADVDGYWEDGGDPAWRFSFDQPSTTDSEQGVKSPATGLTWESVGVPAGAIVKSVRCTQYDDKVVNNSNLSSHSITIDLWDSGGSSVFTGGSLISGVSITTITSPSYTSQSGGSSLAVQSGKSASNTDIRLLIEYTVTTNSGSVNVLYQIKNIDLAITYEFPASNQIFAGTVNPTTTIHSPAVVPGLVTLTPGAIAAGTATHSPTLAGNTALAPAALGDSTAVYAPTFAPAPETYPISSPIFVPPTFHAPTLASTATISAGTIAANTQVNTPVANAGNTTVSVAAIGPATTFYGPALAGLTTLTPAAISSNSQLYAPAFAPGNTNVSAGTIAPVAQFYTPAITGDSAISPAGIAAGTQLYSLTFAPGGITVAAGTVSAGTQIHAPALNQAISVVAVGPDTTIYGPSLQVGGTTIQPAAIASGTSLNAPTFASSATVTPNAVGATTTLQAPTLAPGAIAVSVGTIEAGSVVHAPSLAASNTLTPEAVAAGTSLYPPTLLAGNTDLPVGTITPGTAFHAPTLVGDGIISPAGISATTSLYAPTIVPGAVTIPVNALGPGANLYSPALSSIFTLQPESIGAATAIHAPTLSPGSVTVPVGTIPGGTVLHAPTLQAGTTTILPDAVAPGTAIHAPALVAGNTNISAGTIGSGSSLFTPTIVAGNANIQAGAIAAETTIYGPSVVSDGLISPAGIAADTTLHAPVFQAGPITVSVGIIGPSTATYAPSLAGGYTLTPSAIAAGTSLFNPTFAATAIITPGAVNDSTQIHSPAVLGANYVTPGSIGANTQIYGPALSWSYTIAAAAIDQATIIYLASLTSDAVIAPGAISAGTQVHAPILGEIIFPFHVVSISANANWRSSEGQFVAEWVVTIEAEVEN